MKFSILTILTVALATDGVVANSWFSKAAYNKWHETELERWLSDHNVPYPKAADRKELSDLVQKNWEENVARPYNSWDVNQLNSYLTAKGTEVKKGTEKNKDSLLKQVSETWTDTVDSASDSYKSVQDWIFDTWTESQLKSFLDYHKIPNPTPRTRDSFLQSARSSYTSIAQKLSEQASYPGDWIYASWSESDLKAWLDERGIPAPQPTTRDKLVASVRRNSRVASKNAAAQYASLSASAAKATQSLTDEIINTWGESQLKKWADENGIPVPQGSKKNDLQALVRKHRARASASAASGYGAATTNAGNYFAQATNDIYDQGKQWYDWAQVQIGLGSDEAKSSVSSLSSAASSFYSSVSSVAEKSASAASKSAVKSSGNAQAAANSARASVSKSASSVSRAASASARSASLSLRARSASLRASASLKSASASVKNEL